MIHNDVLRSVRYMLNLKDRELVQVFALADLEIPLDIVQDYLLDEEDPHFREMPDDIMDTFLNGLIYLRRGKDPNRPPLPLEKPMTNNTALKKLRVAFELRESDIVDILRQAGFPVSPHELNAFFRRPDHVNFRECGDQYLRNFLKGLTQRVLGKDTRQKK